MALRPVIVGIWRRPYPEWGGNICEAKTIKFQMMGEPDMIAGSELERVFLFKLLSFTFKLPISLVCLS